MCVGGGGGGGGERIFDIFDGASFLKKLTTTWTITAMPLLPVCAEDENAAKKRRAASLHGRLRLRGSCQ